MEKKTSSVEWLVEQLRNGCDTAKSIRENIQQAKEMHREEIKEAYNQGYRDAETDCFHVSAHDISTYGNAKKYYNETYGSTKQN